MRHTAHMKLTELTQLVPDYQIEKTGPQTRWVKDGQEIYKPAYLHGTSESKAGFDILYLPAGANDEPIEVEGDSGEHSIKVPVRNSRFVGVLDCIMVWWISDEGGYPRFRCLVCEVGDERSLAYARNKQKEASNEI